MSKKAMEQVFRCERIGSAIRLDSISERKTKSSADEARERMIVRQTRKSADSVSERMTGAEYAREKMLARMLTPPPERK